MKRKRRVQYGDPMPQARLIWQAVYQEPWPRGWKVMWVGFMRGATGLCRYGVKQILLSYGDAKAKPKPVEHLDENYLKALRWAFWFALTEEPQTRSTFYHVEGRVSRVDRVVRPYYDQYTRLASHFRLDKERHSTLARGAIETLLHEFVHLRHGPMLKHGREFDRLVEWSRKRLFAARIEQLGSDAASEPSDAS